MSGEDKYQPPAPNLVRMTKKFKFSLPESPASLSIRDPASPKLTSTDLTYHLWGKEFKFSFEVTPNFMPNLELINKSSEPIWISDLYDWFPRKLSPNEKFPIESRSWNFTINESRSWLFRKQHQIDVEGSFSIAMGIDYDPEPLLQQDLLNLLREKKFTDFKLKCGEEEFPCHKSILAARSSVLADAFTYSSVEDQYEIKGFDPSALKKLLDVLYYGTITVDVDDELQVLADYLDIKLMQEQVPELEPLYERPPWLPEPVNWQPEPGSLQTLKGWREFDLWLTHEIQMEPSFAAKKVEMTWTIPNFEAWREDRLANHVEQLQEKRITFLGKEFVFECHLHLDQNTQTAFLVNKSEGLAFVQSNFHASLVVFEPNSFQRGGWNSCQRLGDGLVVKFNMTLLMFLDNDHKSKLEQDFLDFFMGNKLTDFRLSCGGEDFPCHKAILAARLPDFAQFFEDDPKADHHKIEGFLPAKVKQMLEFIYSETVNGEADLELLQLANRFKIKGLVKLCGRSLAKTVTLANSLDLLDVADRQPDGALKNLEDSVLDFCANNYWELRRSDQWKNRVPKSLVVKICDFSFRSRCNFF